MRDKGELSLFLSELTEGNFPKENNEVVLSEYAKSVLNVIVGDTVQIDGIEQPLTVSDNAFNVQSVKTAANIHLFEIDTSLGVHHATSNRKNFVLMIGSLASV